MIFNRALHREMASVAGATFTVLFSVFVTFALINILGRAAGGKVAPGDVIALIAFRVLNQLPLVLLLTAFIAVLMVLTRSYRDSEMVVWFSSGQSLLRFVRPVMTFGLPLVALVALLAFVVTPWANLKYAEFVQRFEKREDLQRVAVGQFRESASSNRVFFVESSGGTNNMVVENVFVSSMDKGKKLIVVAKQGTFEPDGKGGQYLVLTNGRRYEGVPGGSDFAYIEFERYSMRMAAKVSAIGTDLSVESMSTEALLAAPNEDTKGELLYRISAPVMAVVLMLLAIPLSFVNPRGGSAANLILALLIFFAYNNLNKAAERLVKLGQLSFGVAWWPLHLAALLTAVGLLAWRLNVNHRYHPMMLLNARRLRHLLRAEGENTSTAPQSLQIAG